ncbi:MAG: hypothetical protein Q4C53_09505 [Clostridia bacterium]|nr:hypothetical protein [Clostridia bacterium]
MKKASRYDDPGNHSGFFYGKIQTDGERVRKGIIPFSKKYIIEDNFLENIKDQDIALLDEMTFEDRIADLNEQTAEHGFGGSEYASVIEKIRNNATQGKIVGFESVNVATKNGATRIEYCIDEKGVIRFYELSTNKWNRNSNTAGSRVYGRGTPFGGQNLNSSGTKNGGRTNNNGWTSVLGGQVRSDGTVRGTVGNDPGIGTPLGNALFGQSGGIGQVTQSNASTDNGAFFDGDIRYSDTEVHERPKPQPITAEEIMGIEPDVAYDGTEEYQRDPNAPLSDDGLGMIRKTIDATGMTGSDLYNAMVTEASEPDHEKFNGTKTAFPSRKGAHPW